jgi:aminoglycoside/choline kinase family phosphotransferase
MVGYIAGVGVMTRTDLIAEFLAPTTWVHWTQTPIAADASGRQYMRLSNESGETAILMDADPSKGETIQPFISIGSYLNRTGLAAPKILLKNTEHGLLLLEDLGPNDFAIWSRQHPTDTATLYKAAVDVLVKIHAASAPQGLPRMDPKIGANMVAITAEWYAKDVDQTNLVAAMKDALSALTAIADTLALRDFHAENLIWRPERNGLDRVGLLDFQDAFLAPAGYDLISLLKDARRDVDPILAQDIISQFSALVGQDAVSFEAQCACLGVQRNLRILGVFARLIRRDKKLKYAAFIPRVWSHIQADLAHPALLNLRNAVDASLPAPSSSTIARFL